MVSVRVIVTSRRILRVAAFAAVAYAIGSIQVPRIIQRLVSDEPTTDHLLLLHIRSTIYHYWHHRHTAHRRLQPWLL